MQPAMLRAYGPECDRGIHDPHHGPIPPSATWIDLEEPTREEDKLVEQLKTGKTATFIIFQTPEEGIGIPVSLSGFAQGFDSLP